MPKTPIFKNFQLYISNNTFTPNLFIDADVYFYDLRCKYKLFFIFQGSTRPKLI